MSRPHRPPRWTPPTTSGVTAAVEDALSAIRPPRICPSSRPSGSPTRGEVPPGARQPGPSADWTRPRRPPPASSWGRRATREQGDRRAHGRARRRSGTPDPRGRVARGRHGGHVASSDGGRHPLNTLMEQIGTSSWAWAGGRGGPQLEHEWFNFDSLTSSGPPGAPAACRTRSSWTRPRTLVLRTHTLPCRRARCWSASCPCNLARPGKTYRTG
ncbi:hypothetical protein QJS66_06355 [Kocuria rhizophila]|nr:hypothetical protein QJS66_06355 [Kocuria rhizophila]